MARIYQGLINFLFWKSLLILKRKNYWFQIAIFFLVSLLTTLITAPLMWLTDQIVQDEDIRPDLSSYTVLVLAPILETYLFQHLPFKMMQSFSITRGKHGLYILFTSVIFGCLHTYSVSYILFAFTLGLVLSYIYFFYSNNLSLAFWSTALVHFLRNALAILFEYYDI